MNIYSLRRREPRVTLRTRALIVSVADDGHRARHEGVTTDISPHGASIMVAEELPIGSIVSYFGIGYTFYSRACIRSCLRDCDEGCSVLGLEYLDFANPLVIWGVLKGARRDAQEDPPREVVAPKQPKPKSVPAARPRARSRRRRVLESRVRS